MSGMDTIKFNAVCSRCKETVPIAYSPPEKVSKSNSFNIPMPTVKPTYSVSVPHKRYMLTLEFDENGNLFNQTLVDRIDLSIDSLVSRDVDILNKSLFSPNNKFNTAFLFYTNSKELKELVKAIISILLDLLDRNKNFKLQFNSNELIFTTEKFSLYLGTDLKKVNKIRRSINFLIIEQSQSDINKIKLSSDDNTVLISNTNNPSYLEQLDHDILDKLKPILIFHATTLNEYEKVLYETFFLMSQIFEV